MFEVKKSRRHDTKTASAQAVFTVIVSRLDGPAHAGRCRRLELCGHRPYDSSLPFILNLEPVNLDTFERVIVQHFLFGH